VLQSWRRLLSFSSPCALVMTSPRSTLPWRSSQKNRAPTSLSLIVATPEVASPVTSAVAHLPPIKMNGDAKTGSPVVEGEFLHKSPSQHEGSKEVLPDVKSQENAEAQPPQDRNGTPQSYFRSHFYSRPFPFRPRFRHADMTINSGFWRDAFWTLSSDPIPVLTTAFSSRRATTRTSAT
jgi:hypothetical protein